MLNPFTPDMIDPLIREVVIKLNAAGFETCSSCQGKTCAEDYESDEHCDHSFITFAEDGVLSKMKKKARKHGLYICNGGGSLSAIPDDCGSLSAEEFIIRNLAFPAKVLEMFDLK